MASDGLKFFWLFVSRSGWLCPECTHPYSARGPRESLCGYAGLWHPAGGAPLQKGHLDG